MRESHNQYCPGWDRKEFFVRANVTKPTLVGTLGKDCIETYWN